MLNGQLQKNKRATVITFVTVRRINCSKAWKSAKYGVGEFYDAT